MTKHDEEVELTRRLFLALGYTDFELKSRDRPDVEVVIGGRLIGIEVTVFHVDETAGRGGSALRATEEMTAKQVGDRPYTVCGIVDSLPGLTTRIRNKVAIAQSYDKSRFAELCLLIAGQLPKHGALGSTFALSVALNKSLLNQHCHELLSKSPFDQAYLHLSLEHVIYAWTRSERWLLARSPLASGGSKIGLKDVLRDSEWLCDPTGKARAEAKKVLDELAGQRNKKKDQ